MGYKILEGDCLTSLIRFPTESIDSIIQDPPYEIGFMGNGWDNTGVAYDPKTWRAAHRVLKKGGYMVTFSATRTHHRMMDAMQRAGFEVLGVVAWCYGTGFPKSQNISKFIDKAAGAEREIIGVEDRRNAFDGGKRKSMGHSNEYGSITNKGEVSTTAPATAEAQQWDGWGSGLKPAWEPIIIARKKGGEEPPRQYSSFHYIAKPSKKERNEGCEDLPEKLYAPSNQAKAELKRGNTDYNAWEGKDHSKRNNYNHIGVSKNNHPTVKPVALMEALVAEFSDEGDIVLDSFAGSGTTGIAALRLNREFIGCEMTEEYLPLMQTRLDHAIATLKEAEVVV